MPHNPTLAVFDLDGTLIDSLPDLADAGRQLLRNHGLPQPTEGEIRMMVGDGARKLVERMLAFAVMHGPAGGPVPTLDAATDEFLALYTPRASRLTRPYPGTAAVLEHLHQAGIACAVCTNKPAAAAQKILNDLDLSSDFKALAGGDSFPWRKPDSRHLLGAIELAGYSPRQSIMIGDHHNDLLAAAGASVPFIFAGWGYGHLAETEDGTTIAKTIRDVPDLIALMGKQI